ncbi:hypothetical protein GH714_003811 [Hevea brasiliensis]|uniref:RNase H type-1 domain-containing protein n=1 Tax=Hevea brasiliensis TaxID=3981 RepID=A0A6A6L8R1_HEVBR|nr:hypothetical protein GH714_003811 [Hevea brasiliensis]
MGWSLLTRPNALLPTTDDPYIHPANTTGMEDIIVSDLIVPGGGIYTVKSGYKYQYNQLIRALTLMKDLWRYVWKLKLSPKEWQLARVSMVSYDPNTVPVVIKWQPLDAGLKCNVDACFDAATGLASVGLVIRGSNGQFVEGMCKSLGWADKELLLNLRIGRKLAKSIGSQGKSRNVKEFVDKSALRLTQGYLRLQCLESWFSTPTFVASFYFAVELGVCGSMED